MVSNSSHKPFVCLRTQTCFVVDLNVSKFDLDF